MIFHNEQWFKVKYIFTCNQTQANMSPRMVIFPTQISLYLFYQYLILNVLPYLLLNPVLHIYISLNFHKLFLSRFSYGINFSSPLFFLINSLTFPNSSSIKLFSVVHIFPIVSSHSPFSVNLFSIVHFLSDNIFSIVHSQLISFQ